MSYKKWYFVHEEKEKFSLIVGVWEGFDEGVMLQSSKMGRYL